MDLPFRTPEESAAVARSAFCLIDLTLLDDGDDTEHRQKGTASNVTQVRILDLRT